MVITNSKAIIENQIMSLSTLCSFWKNFSGQFQRFACNHSYCYAFRRIVETDSLSHEDIFGPKLCILMKYPS
jgi:hypothetical protein